MSASQMLGRISASPISQQLAAELLVDVSQTTSSGQFLELALPKLIRACEATTAAIFRPDQGTWQQRFATSALESFDTCLLYTSPSPRDQRGSRMPSSA